ncbi:ribulokinase [Propionivibrio sp.]|uniref:ribulokinase n=1 Tax=Propionivibrio sp. TaxID=2212460 RepID=UPI0039E3DA73
MKNYTIGIDFGTLSGRALLVDASDGREVATAVHDYADGVIDRHLPGGRTLLPPNWALQNPADYLEVLRVTIPELLRASGVDPSLIKGVGIDFTACTFMPARRDGTPLCMLPRWADQPHAWPKLWKHHASQPQADQVNAVARERGEPWLPLYGGKISSEWSVPKMLQVLQEAPEVYAAAERFMEAGDWVVWQLTGREVRSACFAGYKCILTDAGFPGADYFAALDPRFADVVDTRLTRDFRQLGELAGPLSERAAALTGLLPGTAVAVANVDAHVTVPAVKVTGSRRMVAIMGTSTCHMLIGDRLEAVEGMCGVVHGGIVPGVYGYEAGQSCVGDGLGWFVEHAVPESYHRAARAAGLGIHEHLERESAKQRPGEHGLVALDWLNGNRSTLVDTDLSGMLLGVTLATRAPDIYRALIEATAFGTRTIIEAFERKGVPVDEYVAAGGLPQKNALLRQIYADVLGKPVRLAGSAQAPALGSAIYAAVAAGLYPDIHAAAERMGHIRPEAILPIPANQAIYDRLYDDYRRLYDYFGRGENDAMKRLKAMRSHAA